MDRNNPWIGRNGDLRLKVSVDGRTATLLWDYDPTGPDSAYLVTVSADIGSDPADTVSALLTQLEMGHTEEDREMVADALTEALAYQHEDGGAK